MVVNKSGRDPLVIALPGDSLHSALQKMIDTPCQRVVIVDAGSPSAFMGVISQSAIAGAIVQEFSKLATGPNRGKWIQGNLAVKDLGLITEKIVSISENDQVIEALYQMHQNSVSSVAILNQQQNVPEY